MYGFPAEVKRGGALSSCFSSLTVNKCLFFAAHWVPCCGLFLCFLQFFWFFLLALSLFKMAPKYWAELIPAFHKCKRNVMCLVAKIHVLGKLCSGMSYGATGHKFSVNRSTIHIKWGVYRQTHTEHKVIYSLFDEMLGPEALRNITH